MLAACWTAWFFFFFLSAWLSRPSSAAQQPALGGCHTAAMADLAFLRNGRRWDGVGNNHGGSCDALWQEEGETFPWSPT